MKDGMMTPAEFEEWDRMQRKNAATESRNDDTESRADDKDFADMATVHIDIKTKDNEFIEYIMDMIKYSSKRFANKNKEENYGTVMEFSIMRNKHGAPQVKLY